MNALLEKLGLIVRLLSENEPPDQVSGWRTFGQVVLLLVVISLFYGLVGTSAALAVCFILSLELTLIPVGLYACVVAPLRLTFYAIQLTDQWRYSQVNVWLHLAGVTSQEMAWGWVVKALYRRRRTLIFSLILAPAFMVLYEMFPGQYYGCLVNGGRCFDFPGQLDPLIFFVWTLPLVVWLGGLYLLAGAAGVYASLRFGKVRAFNATLWPMLVVIGISLNLMLRMTFGAPVLRPFAFLCALVMYFLAAMLIRISKGWMWKPVEERHKAKPSPDPLRTNEGF